ncbi:MAG: phosphoserine phosphatase SerB [Hyphomicrobiales bacterium]|nr:phosphoserine phosphatase SerB [Hyphomicrobiales bacterium]
MTHVATLICNPRAPALDPAALERARTALPGAMAPRWLAEGVAADVEYVPLAGFDARAALAQALGDLPVDIIAQPTLHRRKRLFVADMDSTIIEQECIDELADLVGLKAHVAAITERAMRGEIAFEPALRERVALLRGLDAHVIDRVIAERITLTPGARVALATMRAHGAYTALVSGGFTPFTRKIAQMAGFDENRANELVVENGHFSGVVAEPILGAQAKLDALSELRARFALDPAETMAAGDGANDLPMLQAAGLGVAFHAKPAVAAGAAARLDHGDLTGLLYIQGYARHDFVV